MSVIQALLHGAARAAPALVLAAALTLVKVLAFRAFEEPLRRWMHTARRRLALLAPAWLRSRSPARRRHSFNPLAAALIALGLNALMICLELWALSRGDARLAVLVAGLTHDLPEFASHVVTVAAIALRRERWEHSIERYVSRIMLASAWLANAFALRAVDHPHRGGTLAVGVAVIGVVCDATAAGAYASAARGDRRVEAHGWAGVVRRQATHMKIDFVTGLARAPGSAAAARGLSWLDPAAAMTMATLMVWGAVQHRHEDEDEPSAGASTTRRAMRTDAPPKSGSRLANERGNRRS